MNMKNALIVLGLQKAYFNKHTPYYIPDAEDILRRINRVIKYFRQQDKPIIFVRHIHRADGSDLDVMTDSIEGVEFKEGTDSARYVEGLDQTKDDIHIVKTRYDAFYKTELEETLKKNDVNEIVLVGFMANYCCYSTAFTAYNNDYKVKALSDTFSTPSLGDIGFGRQESKKLVNITLTSIAYGIGEVMTANAFMHYDQSPS